MVSKELQDYIKSVKSKGYSNQAIKEHLLKHGYTQDIVNEAFSRKKSNPMFLIIPLVVIVIVLAIMFWPKTNCEGVKLEFHVINDEPQACVFPDHSKIQLILKNSGTLDVNNSKVTVKTSKGKVTSTLEKIQAGDVYPHIIYLEKGEAKEISVTPLVEGKTCTAQKISKELVIC